MEVKGVDTIVSDVRVCLDEIGLNEAELIGGTDTDDMNEVIESKIADAIRYVYLNADLAFITPEVKSADATSDKKGVVRITLGDDFLRLCFARLADWEFTVTEAIAHTDKRYATLKNPITTGYPDNPKAAIVDGAEGKSLELYSSSTKSGDVEYTYGYIGIPTLIDLSEDEEVPEEPNIPEVPEDGGDEPAVVNEDGGSDEPSADAVYGYKIDGRVYRAIVYQTAGLTLQAFKDAHADSMFNMALTIMK
jgi:hypothetical protein